MTSHNLDLAFMERLGAEAERNQRNRAHYNLHASFEDSVQRVCVALKYGTYVRPHRHPQQNKWELLVVLKGRLGILLFDAEGVVLERMELEAGGDLGAVELQPGVWHAVFPLGGDAVILDIKEGPYRPDDPVEFAPWSPEERGQSSEGGDQRSKVAKFLEWAESANFGERWPLCKGAGE